MEKSAAVRAMRRGTLVQIEDVGRSGVKTIVIGNLTSQFEEYFLLRPEDKALGDYLKHHAEISEMEENGHKDGRGLIEAIANFFRCAY